MKNWISIFLLGCALSFPAQAVSQKATSTQLLNFTLTYPAHFSSLSTYKHPTTVHLAEGLTAVVGGGSALIHFKIRQFLAISDDSTGMEKSNLCHGQIEILGWKSSTLPSKTLFQNFLNSARRAKWSLRSDGTSNEAGMYFFSKGEKQAFGVLRAFKNHFVVILCKV